MRTRSERLIAVLALSLAGCSSGGTVVVRHPPPPAPAPVVVEPLEVDIARPHNGKLFVQTNRAAYVAIFDIVPERGVTLVYPVSTRQRRFVVSGLRDVPVWWEPSRVTYRGGGMSSSRSNPARYIYVLASDEPLRIPDAAFRDGYLYETLGNRAYRATNPYATMRALAREFVPSVIDEAWAEDAYALSASYATERYQVTRVYCRGGSMYEVPSDLADHVWCPAYPRGAWDGPGRVAEVDPPGSRRPMVRPDSVVGDNGRRVATRPPWSNGRGPIQRVKEPPGWENRSNGRGEDDNRPGNSGNGQAKGHQEDGTNGRGRVSNDHPENGSDGRGRKADDQQGNGSDGRARRPNDDSENGANGRARRPNDRQDDVPPGQRRADVKEAMRVPPRPTPLPVAANEPTRVEGRDNSATSDTPAKPDRAEKPNKPEKPETPAKPETSVKADTPVKPETPVKPDTGAETSPDSKSESKSQGPAEKRGGPAKGRGRPNDADDKSADRKPKQSADSKP